MKNATKVLTTVFSLANENLLSVALVALIYPITMLECGLTVVSMSNCAKIMYCTLGLSGLIYEVWVIYCFLSNKN